MEIIKELGLTSVNVTRSTRDWDPSTTTEQIVERSLKDITSGDVILMHSWSLNTFNALSEILLCLTEKGFRCITISEL
jgi:peptidoglycan/xylan/chitin deacetylase (PgdA/CDA1 family)